jgi:hypothetical protein
MLTYHQVQRNARHFKSLTSLEITAFEQLFVHFDSVVDHHLTHFTLTGKVRQRRSTVKADSVFRTRQDMLLFILMYLKNKRTGVPATARLPCQPIWHYPTPGESMDSPHAGLALGNLGSLKRTTGSFRSGFEQRLSHPVGSTARRYGTNHQSFYRL